jgi:heat shock protein HslJ
MDDAQGRTRVPDPSRFTLHLSADGRVTLRLDCNRGAGRYVREPSADGASGSLSFGPLATTRARCAPPHLDERVVRDLAYVRSYMLRDGLLFMSLMADGGIYEWEPAPTEAGVAPAPAPAPDAPRVRGLTLPPEPGSVLLRDRIRGRGTLDVQVRGEAGQRLTAELSGRHGALSFNVLPPGSNGPALWIGDVSGRRADVLLPDDGTYTLRVFLQRAAARRGESAPFDLRVARSGVALPPLAPAQDALVSGTRFHARAMVPCWENDERPRQCEAGVVRRQPVGSATVEVHWGSAGVRRVLFVSGTPAGSDSAQPLRVTREAAGWRLTFGAEGGFVLPEGLVTGG